MRALNLLKRDDDTLKQHITLRNDNTLLGYFRLRCVRTSQYARAESISDALPIPSIIFTVTLSFYSTYLKVNDLSSRENDGTSYRGCQFTPISINFYHLGRAIPHGRRDMKATSTASKNAEVRRWLVDLRAQLSKTLS